MANNKSYLTNDRASLDFDLTRYLMLFKKRWLVVIAIMLGTSSVSVLIAILTPATYQANAKLLIKVDRTSALTGFGEGVGELSPLVTAQNPLSTELEVMTSRPLLTKVVERLNLKNAQGEPVSAQQLQEKIKAEIVGGADVIQISVENSNPQAAAEVVNALAKIYVDDNIAGNRSQSTKALDLLEQRLPELEAFVSQSEANLKNFKETNSIISLPEEAKSTVEILEDTQSQAFTTAVELQEATVRTRQIQDNLGLTAQQAVVVSAIAQDPAVQGVLEDIQELERQKSIELGFYTQEGPVVQLYQAQINALQALLQQRMAIVLDGNQLVRRKFWQVGDTQQAFLTSLIEAETVRLSLSQRLTALEGVLTTYQERGSSIPQLEQREAELERELEVASASYQSSLQKLQELQSAETQVVGNARLIEPAIVPEDPISDKKSIVVAGIVVGAFLSTAAVALLELIGAQRQARSQAALAESDPGLPAQDPSAVPDPVTQSNQLSRKS